MWITQEVKASYETFTSQPFFIKIFTTSAYFTSSISLGFNPILQKFYDMIFEVIFSKTKIVAFY